MVFDGHSPEPAPVGATGLWLGKSATQTGVHRIGAEEPGNNVLGTQGLMNIMPGRVALPRERVFFNVPMPGSRRDPSFSSSTNPLRPAVPRPPAVRTLLVIDNAPLQRTAWAAYLAANKRVEKAARDLHRHEEVDRPAYEKWVSQTFPVYLSTLRELHQQVFTKARQVEAVQAMAALTGRSLRKLWAEQKEYEADPDAFEAKFGFNDDAPESEPHGDRRPPDDHFEYDDGDARDRRSQHNPFDAFENAHRAAPPSPAAKDVYRRLVQRLHPDRGGEWTAARKKLWHEVQQAWAAGDTDWLMRLEMEWETASETLTPTSPLGRLRRAVSELAAARRDLEHKLRDYRKAVEWRFTLSPKKREALHRRTEANFRHDVEFLERQLAYLNATIAAWEKPRPRHRTRAADYW